MFVLKRPFYTEGDSAPNLWKVVDQDEDYGQLLKRNLVAGQTVGAVSFGNDLVYLVFLDESILKVVFEPKEALDTKKDQT